MLKGLLLLHLLTLAMPTMANASLYHAETTTVETQNSISNRTARDEEEDVDYLDDVSSRIDYNMLLERRSSKPSIRTRSSSSLPPNTIIFWPNNPAAWR